MVSDIDRIQQGINDEILQSEKLLSVNKPIEIECDVGNLLSTDVNPHNVDKFVLV